MFARRGEQAVGHDGERPGVAAGMGAERVLEAGRHEGGVAGLLEQAVEHPGELAGLGGGHDEALADT